MVLVGPEGNIIDSEVHKGVLEEKISAIFDK
jgi:hypothetical protein